MITRYGRSFGGYAWAILEPVGWIMILSLALSALVRVPALGSNVPLFLATGFLTFLMYRRMAEVVGRSINANKPLFFFPRVLVIHAVIARYVLQFLTGIAVSCICYLAIMALFDVWPTIHIIPVLVANLTASFLGLGVGLVNCTLFNLSKTYSRVFDIVNRPLFIVSAVFYIPEKLPPRAQEFLFYNPVVHLVGLTRRGFYPGYDADYVNLIYVFAVTLTLIFSGLVLLRLFRGRVLEA